MDFDERFFRHMGTWLNADELSTGDQEELKSRASMWASAVAEHLTSAEQFDRLLLQLTNLLSAPEWNPEFVQRAMQHTNVDWTADDAASHDLRAALQEMVDSLKIFRAKRAPAVNP